MVQPPSPTPSSRGRATNYEYATGKCVKVAEFEEGEHVSVNNPKAIQHPTDL